MKRLVCLGAVLACLVCTPSVFAWPGCEVDRLSAVVDGSTVTVHHDAAAYNCCADGFDYAVEVVGAEVRVVETELLPEPCLCLCCYNLSVEIADLAPGEYVLLFTWYDDSGEWITWTDTFVVEDVGQGGAAHVGNTTNSGCYDPNASPEPGVELSLWGKVKAQYR